MKLVTAINNLCKSFGSKELFDNLSLSFLERQKVAIIGKNGSGKSTLLKIIAGLETQDSGQVTLSKNARVSYIPQSPQYDKSLNVMQALVDDPAMSTLSDDDRLVQCSYALSTCGFTDFEQSVSALSGGWVKRLALAKALCHEPDLLLLDEPTNHMDWDSIRWLETFLKKYNGAIIVISHDREFLNAVTQRTIEIGAAFVDQYLSFDLPYDQFILKRQEYFEAQQKLASSLSNKARRELEWLRAGVKARTTKSQSRINEAYKVFDHLDKTKSRIQNTKNKVQITIDSTERKSKKLIELKGVSKSFGDTHLIKDLSLTLAPKMRLALLGANGSGKTTLVKIMTGDISPDKGDVILAEDLNIVYFDQHKTILNEEQNIFEFLGDGGDYVTLKDKSVHVAGYAQKFLFSKDQFYLKIRHLSGGERARLQLAKILLQPCDVLILDEPTNDLDIDSLIVLEESLTNTNIGLILISHDRSFIENICTDFLALDSNCDHQFYASLSQWLNKKPKSGGDQTPLTSTKKISPSKKRKKLSYNDQRELDTIEQTILKKEDALKQLNNQLNSKETQGNSSELIRLSKEVADLQIDIQSKYDRWQQLED